MKFTKNKIIFLSCLIYACLANVLVVNLTASQAQGQLLKSVKEGLESQKKSVDAINQKLQKLEKSYEKLDKALNKELTFKEGLKFVLAFEGKFSDDEGDAGGATGWGIIHTEYDQYRASKGLPRRSVASISLAEVSDIYKHTYWINSGCSETPRRIALSCLDWEVNAGRGMLLLQDVLGGVSIDGVFGPETLNELNSWLAKPGNEDRLLHNYFEKREAAYRRWGVGNQAKFLHGWLRRAEALKEYLKVP